MKNHSIAAHQGTIQAPRIGGEHLRGADIKQCLKALQQITIEEGGKRFAVRTECRGTCGKVFQAVGVAVPPTIRQLEGP